MSRVIVVGGTKGIGAAIAEAARKTHDVVVMGRHVDLSRHGQVELDLRWSDLQVAAACRRAMRWFGPVEAVDALVLSAGMGAYLAPYEMDQDRLQSMFRVNVLGPIAAYLACLRGLMRARGRVLFIGSTVARKPGASGLSAYAATKGAVNAFVISEARRLADHGVAMNVLAPGWVSTEMTAEIQPELKEAITRAIPAKRFAYPEEVARFALAILEQSNFLTGEILSMAGGA